MRSQELFERACKVIPGGVNSPVRAFTSVGGDPVYVERGEGSRIWTVDGQELIDFCCSWGPLIFGHAHPDIVKAVCDATQSGSSFGINTEREVVFAELLCDMIPSMDMVRLVSSGTEATMTALRIARGFTGRHKIIKFNGCYHGHADYLLVAAGSGLLTGGITASAGVSPTAVAEVLVPEYNDLEAVKQIVSEQGDDIAAIIVEPVAGNMGLVPPKPGFLEGLRSVADECGALLIFDEVINGFRLAPTTYGATCGITPDLTCLGKIIGGGLPIGAVGGKKEVMQSLAPLGPVYQAGTLSGNPVAVAAGQATLTLLRDQPPYSRLDEFGEQLSGGVNDAASAAGIAMHCPHLGGVFTPFFSANPVCDLTTAKACDTAMHAAFFHGMLEHGFYLPPSQFEVGFVSAAHSPDDIEAFVSACGEALNAISAS